MSEQPERIRGDRGPDAEKIVVAAMKEDYAAGHADLDMAIDLYRHQLAESQDPVLAFGLLKLTLGVDQLDPERILRALAQQPNGSLRTTGHRRVALEHPHAHSLAKTAAQSQIDGR